MATVSLSSLSGPSPPFETTYRIATRALDFDGQDHEAFLREECGQDEDLHRAVVDFIRETQTTGSQSDAEDGGFESMAQGIRSQLLDLVAEEERPEVSADWIPTAVGPFPIQRRIGRGGMGIVYEAKQSSPNRTVALKVLNTQTVSGETVRRFRLEGEALGRLQHPGIAQVFAAGTADLGFGEQPYLAMELIQGSQLLEHAHGNTLNRDAKIALLASICDAAEHAHSRGIVHRDIKPDNVLVDAEGRAKMLDFGIAHVTSDAQVAHSKTTDASRVLGAMGYMAPEQVRDHRVTIGPQADVYALGAWASSYSAGNLLATSRVYP